MGRHEAPPFKMVLERGKLVPATAFDAERLDTYRSGVTVNVRFVEEKNRWGTRKWWAVVNRAVKECPTPWKTAAEASEAIKLALGIVNLTKTVGGEFMAYPKSLTELTDPELEEAVEQMLAVMYRVTGIDPDDWRKQIADIGEDEPDPGSEARSTEPVGSASDHDVPTSDGDATSPAETVEAGTETAEQPDRVPASEISDETANVLRNSMQECIDKFIKSATDPKLDARGRQDAVVFTKNVWKDELTTRPDFVKACTTLANAVVKGEQTADAARAEMERWLP